jgi:DNA-binding XRE family transcriptional regulator
MVATVARRLVVHPEVRVWLTEIRELDRPTAALIAHTLQYVIERSGPEECPPLVGRLKGSRVRRLKELRPASGGRIEVRLLFTFDRDQPMALLVASDRVANWGRWHREAVPLAESRSLPVSPDGASWREYGAVRELVEELSLAPDDLAWARGVTDAHTWAWHLSQVRRDQDRTQAEVAKAMGVTPPKVSEIERGDLDRVTLSSLRTYVSALGGTAQVVADFGDRRYYLR